MLSKNPTIKKLLTHYKKISLLSKTKAILEWDNQVGMPPKGSEGRASQMAYLAELVTQLWKDKDFQKNLETLNSHSASLNLEEAAILRNLNHSNKFYTKIPEEIIVKKEEVAAKAFVVWKEARAKNTFKTFLPYLKELIKISQETAGYLDYKDNPYDALLDLFEPELTADFTDKTFAKVKNELIPLVKKIKKSKDYTDKSKYIDNQLIYPRPDQERLTYFLMSKMGYNLQAGKLDVSPHPFTINLDRYDIRVTTRYLENDFRDSHSSGMHETGHAIYEQGINPDYSSTPLEEGVSMGIHEAMSRFWENMVGKNPQFLRFMYPIYQSFYNKQLSDISESELIRLFNIVKPSFIRIEADEVTYSLHIILRFEMENAIINGKIKPEDAPEAWNEKSQELFGIRPKSDSEGVLQDVHWVNGYFGYFPSYALGNLYGAQLLHEMKKTVNFDEELRNGELENVHKWLGKHIHQYGSLYYPRELIKKATGRDLDPQYFITYLTQKYSKIYNFK